MGQAGNSNRRASLDDQKERAAGRNNEREKIKAAVMPRDTKGRSGGAFGSGGKANKAGGSSSAAAARSTKPARKRNP